MCVQIVDISKKTYENNDIEVIADGSSTLKLNEKHLEEKLGHKHLPVTANKYNPVYKKHRYELVETPKKSQTKLFRSNLALTVIMDCRTNESCNLKGNLGFGLHNVINTK